MRFLIFRLFIFRNIKYYISSDVKFERLVSDTEERTTANFKSNVRIALTHHSLEEDISDCINEINNKCANFVEHGSNWIVNSVGPLKIYITTHEPLSASSYIPTQKYLMKKKAIVNIKNLNDNKCFLYSI